MSCELHLPWEYFANLSEMELETYLDVLEERADRASDKNVD